MITPPATDLANMDADALRQLLQDSWAERQALEDKIRFKDTRIAQLTHEITALRRYQFGKKGEQLSGVQGSLLEEAVCADIAAIEVELEQLTETAAPKPKQ